MITLALEWVLPPCPGPACSPRWAEASHPQAGSFILLGVGETFLTVETVTPLTPSLLILCSTPPWFLLDGKHSGELQSWPLLAIITCILSLPLFLPLKNELYVYVKVKSLSRVRLFATPWTVVYQAPPSMGFFRQE